MYSYISLKLGDKPTNLAKNSHIKLVTYFGLNKKCDHSDLLAIWNSDQISSLSVIDSCFQVVIEVCEWQDQTIEIVIILMLVVALIIESMLAVFHLEALSLHD